MPYRHEEIDLDCSALLCKHNECGSCSCDCGEDELNPDNSDCTEFEFNSGCFSIDVRETQIEAVLETIKDQEIPFVSLNEISTKFQTIVITDGAYCLVQGSDEDIMQFRFWKHVDVDVE
jgi:hypothetical protein